MDEMGETADSAPALLRKGNARFSILAALFLIVVSFVTLGQRPAQSQPRVIPGNLAPAEILRQVMQLRKQRDSSPRQGEGPDALDRFVAGVWQGLRLPDKWKGRCQFCGSLLVEEQSGFVVLRMEVESWNYRFIVFDSNGTSNGWRIAGYADTFSKYRTTTSRFELNSQGKFLVVVYSTGGTGALDAGESWYELSPDSSREVLSYPAEGYDSPFFQSMSNGGYFLGRGWQSRLLHPPDRQDPTTCLEFTISYHAGDGDLFSKKQTAVFRWDAVTRTYRFDEQASAMPRVEFEAVYGFPRMDPQEFIKYNFAALREIAEQGTAARKSWLRSFLTDAGSDPQAADLIRRIR
jgi:hypothetical protein